LRRKETPKVRPLIMMFVMIKEMKGRTPRMMRVRKSRRMRTNRKMRRLRPTLPAWTLGRIVIVELGESW